MVPRFLLLAALSCAVLVMALQSTAPAGHSASHPCDLVASTAGSNANPGTLAQPFATVQKLVNSLQPGQTGCLRGTAASQPFTQNVNVLNKNPTANNPTEADRITIRSYPGEIAKLRGRLFIADSSNFITFSKLVLDGRDALTDPPTLTSPRIDGNDIVFEDNNVTSVDTVTCFKLGIAAGPADRVTLRRNRIHDCFDGVFANYSSGAGIVDNLIYDNSGWGVRLFPNADSSAVNRNVIDGNAGGVLFAGDVTNTSIGNAVSRNVIANSSPNPNVDSSWDPFNTPPMQFNFVAQSCVYKPPADDGDSGIDGSAGGFNTSQIDDKNPGYDSAANDFHIASANPCYQHTGDVAATVDAGGGPNDEQATASNSKPNVLFIVTDDQRADGTILPENMPETVARLRNGGTEYTNAFATTPICCPGRASILSGRYTHNHGVHTNVLKDNLDHQTTLQAKLDEAGYRTGIFGKFLNKWDLVDDPPYWDRWAVFNQGHCGWKVNEQGAVKTYGTFGSPPSCAPGAPFSADYIADQAIGTSAAPGTGFLDETEADDSQPWFMYLAPYQPHLTYTTEDEYKDLDVGSVTETPAHTEGQSGGDPITDKPQHIQWLCKANPSDSTCTADPLDAERLVQRRMLKSVDDMVGNVLKELDRLGEQDTIVVYVSDNGYMWGEHGIPLTKALAYTESIKVPMLMRYAPFTGPGAQDSRMVANIDLMPTAIDAADANLPTVDGFSLLNPANQRNRIHTEFQNGGTLTDDGVIDGDVPGEAAQSEWASTRTSTYQYIEHYGEDGISIIDREYYAASDTHQLTNLFGDGVPGNEPSGQALTDLHEQLKRDRFCRGSTECPGGTGQGPLSDPIDPRSAITAPTHGSYVCCRQRLAATASDNLAIEWIQLQVDGANIGPLFTQPDYVVPYQVIWNTNSAAQVPQVTQHQLRALVRDTAGREASYPITVNVDKGLDIQIDDGGVARTTCPNNPSPCNVGTINPGDTITYSFGRVVNPGDFVPGWNGSAADCTTQPSSCVRVHIDNVDPDNGSDSLKIHSNTAPHGELVNFGTIALGDDNYAGATRDFDNAKIEMIDGNTRIRVTLSPTNPLGPDQTGAGATAIWTTPSGAGSYCNGCQVRESLDGTETMDDREF